MPEAKEPWVTNEILEAIRDKDNLLGKAKRTRSEQDWVQAKKARNEVGRAVQNLKIDYLKTQQTTHQNDPKEFWKSISTISPGKAKSSTQIWLKDSTSGIEIEPENIPDHMNSFFTNVGPQLASRHTSQWKYYGVRVDHDMPQIQTDVEEVINLCREIEILKSSGIEEISFRLCKEGYRETVGNYRPISLLPLPGKLLEKVVHSRISAFLDDNNFLTDQQGGFRKGYSTTSIIADLTDDIFSDINNGGTTLTAFVNLKKAFYTVDPTILLRKLEEAGIRGKALGWCVSCLTGRSQKTLVNGLSSSERPITCGVPQGSVLGPLFFLIYVNDLQEALKGSHFRLYADDTVLYQAGLNAEEASSALQDSLDKFCHRSTSNRLTINTSKTKAMVFGSHSKVKKAKNVKVTMNGVTLKKVPTFKYLGLTLTQTLNYNHHITSIIRMVLHKMTLLAKMKKYLNNDVALLIYKTMLLPYLDYADVIFHRSNSADLDKLQRLQNRCLRICLGHDRWFSCQLYRSG